MAAGFALVTRFAISEIDSIIISFAILFLIVFVGVFFDTLGTAVTAADEKPFHSKAAKKLYGARRGIFLVRHADQVANFCNDVVGDISGVVSGVIGAVIIINLVAFYGDSLGLGELLLSVLLTGLISALTVGGKAIGKNLAITRSTEVVWWLARVVTTLEKLYFWKNRGKSQG